MISVFLREQKRYTLEELLSIFQTEKKTISILRRLKEYGVVKAVKASDEQRNLSDLVDEDIAITDIKTEGNDYLYVIPFVGVITVEGEFVLKCYPKYLLHVSAPKAELKQVLKVLEKYNNSKNQDILISNDTDGSNSSNRLAILLFLLRDYFEYGVYTNTQEIIEVNGTGDILWDKTINETFTLLNGNRPYYPELLTVKRRNDDSDYFKRLHECIITRCSEELRDADLLDLFDITDVDISDAQVEDFGDKEYILGRINRELNIQFNTRKQLLLKTMSAYIEDKGTKDNQDCISTFGTTSFNLVWENVCAEVLDNQLQKPIENLPIGLNGEYSNRGKEKLIELIEKPQWRGIGSNTKEFIREAGDTLKPDLISIKEVNGSFQFIIFDAKYYNLQLDEDKLSGQPGIESITKQYLYQLAFKPFLDTHNIKTVLNCFLFPTASEEVINKGTVSLKMLNNIGLQDIQVRLLPAKEMYQHYIDNTKIDIGRLKLDFSEKAAEMHL